MAIFEFPAMLRKWLTFRTISLALAILLAVTATLKLHMLFRGPFADLKPFYSLTISWLAVISEIAAILLTLSSASNHLKWNFLASLFSVFFTVSTYNVIAKKPSCDCAGVLEVNPVWPLVTAAAAVFLLFLAKRTCSQEIPSYSFSNAAIGGMALSAMLFLAVFAICYSSYGKQIMQALLGETSVTSSVIFISETSELVTKKIILTNQTDLPISVIGLRTSCTCLSIEGHKDLIPPLGQVEFYVIMNPNGNENTGIPQRAIFFLDAPKQRFLSIDL